MSVGKFVISLDFELMWGVSDLQTINEYGDNIIGVHKVIPRLLTLFDHYGINATFATVGMLFFKTKSELLQNLPSRIPRYTDRDLSPYFGYFNQVGENNKTDPYHFAPELVKLIQQYPRQEISTHTFSHYYCLEQGQTREDFRADLIQAQKIAAKYNITFHSLVFPRNQFNEDYLDICSDLNILCTRGNESSWIYEARRGKKESITRRAFRLADAYINISGNHCYADQQLKTKLPVNIPASRFLRPYYPVLKILEGLRLKRITSGMSLAAKKGLTYHLWWHPHNFGIHADENFAFLEKIIRHYTDLKEKYGFESHTMLSAARSILQK